MRHRLGVVELLPFPDRVNRRYLDPGNRHSQTGSFIPICAAVARRTVIATRLTKNGAASTALQHAHRAGLTDRSAPRERLEVNVRFGLCGGGPRPFMIQRFVWLTGRSVTLADERPAGRSAVYDLSRAGAVFDDGQAADRPAAHQVGGLANGRASRRGTTAGADPRRRTVRFDPEAIGRVVEVRARETTPTTSPRGSDITT